MTVQRNSFFEVTLDVTAKVRRLLRLKRLCRCFSTSMYTQRYSSHARQRWLGQGSDAAGMVWTC